MRKCPPSLFGLECHNTRTTRCTLEKQLGSLSVARCKLYRTQVAHRVYVDGGLESRRPAGNVQRSFGTYIA